MQVTSGSIPNIFYMWIKLAQKFIDDYDKGEADYSMTEIIQPPRISFLKKMYHDQMEVSIEELWASLVGTAIHNAMESVHDADSIQEKRFYITILDRKIGLKPDIITVFSKLPSGHLVYKLHDYKTMKPGAVRYGVKPDYTKQANGYTYALRQLGMDVQYAAIEWMAVGWDYNEYIKGIEGYPKNMVGTFPVPLWTNERTKAFLENRIKLYKACEGCTANNLPFCTMDERWQKPDAWIVSKRGKNRQLPRLKFLTEQEAISAMRSRKDNAECEVLHRKSPAVRCERWCSVKSFCNQYKEYVSKGVEPTAAF